MPRETTAAIQAAVDALGGEGGGVCRIGAGDYELDNAIYLRHRVTLRGDGERTVLRPIPAVRSPLVTYVGYGHYDVRIAQSHLFHVGMGVHIGDGHSCGFYDTTASLTWRDGDRFGLSEDLKHDYTPEHGATITAAFPVVAGLLVADAAVENLQIAGPRCDPFHLNGCRGGGVYLRRADRVAIRGVTVRGYPGEGISFQQCRNTLIEDCRLIENLGHGLHPGSGSVGPVMRRLECRGNRWCGVFYCLRVNYSILEDCIVEGNGQAGLSIGAHDTDNLIRRCTIANNARPGVFWRPEDRIRAGHRITLIDNTIRENVRDGQAAAEIDVDAGAEDIRLCGNTICPRDGVAALHVGDRAVSVFAAEGDALEPTSGNTATLKRLPRDDASFAPAWLESNPPTADRHLPPPITAD